MTDRIRLLPEVVANQIAAGEVVGHPSSVVKEMMENALDAGAQCVTVNFRDGGKELIQIVDDGCGMSPVDARLAFDRHATSKIASVDDIYRLHTFGFRGEALASIAAVAQVELRTRPADSETGTRTEIHGGRFVSQEAVMCPAGSQFFVRNLFYNVPARRRFLEKTTTATSQIKSEFRRVALCNPQIRFELYANDSPLYILPATSLAGRIVDVVGRYIKQNLLEVDADTSIVRVTGFVGRPAAAKKANAEQYLFVNGRYFRSPYFQKAVQRAYDKLIPEGAYPSYFLYLEIDPERIDVNVHPQKTEVKFADDEAVWQIINAAVRETLGKTGAVPLMDFDQEDRVDIPVLEKGTVYREPPAQIDRAYNPFRAGYLAGEQDDADGSGGMRRAPARSATGGIRESDDGWLDIVSSTARDRVADLDPVSGAPGLAAPAKGGAADASAWSDSVAAHDDFEFVPSGAVAEQQSLLGQERPVFSAPVALGEGFAAALYGGRLTLIDLRRARERVLYEDYMLLLGNGSTVSQQLLFPERLVLSEREYALMEENAVDFAALGFDVDYLGDCAVEVRGTPADMPGEGIDRLIYDLLRIYDTPVDVVSLRRERLAATMARSGARSLREVPAVEELAALLDRLAQCDTPHLSPSGKNVLSPITPAEIRSRLG